MGNHEWVNGPNRRYVLSADDIPELEREAGVHEFINKKPREEAEAAAYDSYRRKHHLEAAAHHLAMMRAAGASGAYNDAKKHKLVYDMHLQQLGFDPTDHGVPEEIKGMMNDPNKNPGLRFKAHKGDAFLLNKSEPLTPPVNEWEDWEKDVPVYNFGFGNFKKSEAKLIELRKSDSPLAINFMTNKLRQLRDFLDAQKVGAVNENELDETMRQRFRGSGVPRDYAGNFNRDAIQNLINQAPVMNYNWSTGQFDRAVGATQRHSDELSNVLRFEITPEIERKLRDAGVWDSFATMQRLSRDSGHPSNDRTAGWVRWTGDKSGVHLDELQSDFGRPWPGMLAEGARRGDFGNPIAEEQIPGFIEQIARQHHLEEPARKLIQKILFGNKHPGEFLHEAFNAWARGPGNLEGAPLHVWQPESKLWIANRDEDTRGHFSQSRPIPGHMQVTYRDVPVKRGMGEGKYGQIPTQKNPALKRAPPKTKVKVGNVGEDILWRPSNKTYKDVVRGQEGTQETAPAKKVKKDEVVATLPEIKQKLADTIKKAIAGMSKTDEYKQGDKLCPCMDGNTKDPQSDCPKCHGNGYYNEADEKGVEKTAIPLSKPPVSEAQRRLVHARAAEGEAWAKEWAAEDKGGKLPERAEKAQIDPNKIKTRDESIRRSKLPPGAPGSDKAGVGVQTDKKKEADKQAARKWKPGKEE